MVSLSTIRNSSIRKTVSCNDINKAILDESNEFETKKEAQILEDFNLLMENMNLSEEKKIPLQNLPLMKKREMLTMNYKSKDSTNLKAQNKKKPESPEDFTACLSSKDLSSEKALICIDSLKVSLTNNSLQWLQGFGIDGLKQILNLLKKSFNEESGEWEKIKLGCVKCLKAIMNNKVGLKSVLEMEEALTVLSR